MSDDLTEAERGAVTDEAADANASAPADTEPDTEADTEADTAGDSTDAGDESDSGDDVSDEDDAEDKADGADGADDADDDADDENPLETEGEIAADYLEELLDIADFDGDIDTYVESNRPHVSVLTDTDVLVGADGEVLDALQELSRLAVMTETGNRSRLMLDIGGYREKRRQQLVELATDAVQEVRTSGDSVRLQPMNPFERKIIHDAVAAAGLSSESEGEEPRRRVVVMPSA